MGTILGENNIIRRTIILALLFVRLTRGYNVQRVPNKLDIVPVQSPVIIPYGGYSGYSKKDIVVNGTVPAILLERSSVVYDDNSNEVTVEESNEPEPIDADIMFKEEDELDESSDIPIGTPETEIEVPGEPLTPQDFDNAAKLEILVPPQDENSPDPILTAGLFEGDIAGVNISDFTPFEKNAIRDMNKRWSRGVIPYVISSSFSLYERSVIAAAVQNFHAYTCIRFVPRTTQRDYVHLVKGAGCSSLVGHFGGGQYVSLGPGCVYKGIVEHELMHACGFWHEQSRGDRDDYVRIVWQNILPGQEHNFQKFGWRISQSLGVQYDTGSIMHYGRNAFSRDYRSPTIIPRNPDARIGQRRGFSEIDLLKINRLYQCRGGVPMPVLPPVTGPKPNECSNNHRFCQYWANTGECKKNPAWMNVNCAKSCRVCPDSNCGNYNKNCENWARIGECTKNPDYMAIYCPRACHACHGTNEEISKCKDSNRYCKPWAKNGQCRANPNYMLLFCKESCGQCTSDSNSVLTM